MEMTPGQKRTHNARIALMTRTAERHKEKHIAALELLGYIVTAPDGTTVTGPDKGRYPLWHDGREND